MIVSFVAFEMKGKRIVAKLEIGEAAAAEGGKAGDALILCVLPPLSSQYFHHSIRLVLTEYVLPSGLVFGAPRLLHGAYSGGSDENVDEVVY